MLIMGYEHIQIIMLGCNIRIVNITVLHLQDYESLGNITAVDPVASPPPPTTTTAATTTTTTSTTTTSTAATDDSDDDEDKTTTTLLSMMMIDRQTDRHILLFTQVHDT